MMGCRGQERRKNCLRTWLRTVPVRKRTSQGGKTMIIAGRNERPRGMMDDYHWTREMTMGDGGQARKRK